ncbi:SAM-dependent methyltransferase [Bounagaea algeriensis]
MSDEPQLEQELAAITGAADLDRPNAARMYDYYLGGSQNLALDREAAEQALSRFPHTARSAQANRAFLTRAVHYCLDNGIQQFLDLGSGIPTKGNVHEVAHARDADARVAYVDIEPVAVAHARRLLHPLPQVTVTQADLRDPQQVLTAPGVADLFDWHQPVAVLCVAVLHFVSDRDDPGTILARYRHALAAGSALVLSHVSDDQPTEELAAPHRAVAEVYQHSNTPAYLRDRASIAALLEDAALAEPGLVDALHWRPTTPSNPADRCGFYAAIAQL